MRANGSLQLEARSKSSAADVGACLTRPYGRRTPRLTARTTAFGYRWLGNSTTCWYVGLFCQLILGCVSPPIGR